MKRAIPFFVLSFALALYSASALYAGSAVRKAPKGLLKMDVFSATDAKPLQGVKVTARSSGSVKSAVTDKEGHARISLAAGQWKVSVERRGWQSQSNTVKIEPGRFIGYEVKLQPAGTKPTTASWIPSTGGLIPGRF